MTKPKYKVGDKVVGETRCGKGKTICYGTVVGTGICDYKKRLEYIVDGGFQFNFIDKELRQPTQEEINLYYN